MNKLFALFVCTSILLLAGCGSNDDSHALEQENGNSQSADANGQRGEHFAGTGALPDYLRRERKNGLRQVVLAMLNYESAHQKFPFNSKVRHAELSWRMEILPYLEHQDMFEKMDSKLGPDAQPNAQFASQMPASLGSDGSYSNIVHVKSEVENFRSLSDGSTNTIAFIEYRTGVPWLESNDLTPDEVVQMVSTLVTGDSLLVAMYDGSVRTIPHNIDEQVLRYLLDPRDGNVVPVDWSKPSR